MPDTFNCPHCGGSIKVIPQRTYHQPVIPTTTRNRTFQSVAAGRPPKGLVRSFFWFMRGNKVDFPQPQDLYIRLQSWRLNHHTVERLDHRLDRRITIDDLKELAYIYLVRNRQWSRDNTVRYTKLKQTKHNIIAKDFREYGLLEEVGGNRLVLTSAGKELLLKALEYRL